MANGWTPERRARQAELIRTWKPWTRSTGPRTAEGMAVSSQNRERSLEAAKAEIERAELAMREAKKRYQSMKRS